MGTPFAYGFLDSDVEATCPRCGYPIWVRLVEVIAQTAVTCPVCRSRVWLVDEAGSVHNAAEDIGNALDQTQKAMKGLS